ncbi:MAG: hypothetical protein BWX80_00415 [Candidatus Hydrogenedentes bacterium ADurb.Bin101]|jgi:hypothetical protein|nr:MAG: hypothetical protein BWX80_00415 [Candidatus Hydrogenedentes bacterium ADurb.Bin101]HOC67312.1 hypothetical protein [Candidatus Hydrogenedentota bacterium]HOH31204.1 hypothetical protein [Candidatus Hydrogenedentota bacterium]
MNDTAPEQCRDCRHRFLPSGEALCRKRMLQKCIQKADRQELMMVPGLCRLLNQDNHCPEFAPFRLLWLRKWLRGR